MGDTNLHKLLGSMFSVNFVLIGSNKVNESKVDLHKAFGQFTQILSLNGTFRDPSGNIPISVSSLYLRFRVLEELNFSLNSVTMKKMLHEQASQFDPLDPKLNVDSCPWFDHWKNTFLSNFELCDHEFVGANFGCIFVITADELANHRQVIADLCTKVKSQATIRWFQPNFYRFYIILDTQTTAMEADPTPEVDFHLIEPVELIDKKMENLNLSQAEHPLAQPTDPTDEDSGDFNTDAQTKCGANQTSVQHHESFLRKLDTLIRDMITNSFLPWSEKQVKLLYEAISYRKGLRRSIVSATKQLLAMSNSVPYRTSGPSNVIYSPEANEMQPRKLADWAMCLRLFDLAAQYYNFAKREFQTDSAWFYYAGACEANALACFQLNRLQKQDFESAISCYLDTCKMPALAIRVALLATDICRKVWPIDAASMFIRLTDKDHNLKAALFLEQAARCFLMSQPARKRRAAFHFVLAGNRYSRCGLKQHALACLMRHGHTNWNRCMEHVDHTLARLHVHLSTASQLASSQQDHHRAAALQLLQKNAHKETFFTEFVRELNQNASWMAHPQPFQVQILTCSRLHVQPNQCYLQTSAAPMFANHGARHVVKNVCFVNENQLVSLTLSCAFRLDVHNFRLLTSSPNVDCDCVDFQLDETIERTVKCAIRPRTTEQFQVHAFQYTSNGIHFIQPFNDKTINSKLQFKSIETLPPLQLSLKNGQREVDALELFAGEIIDLFVHVQPNGDSGDWSPARMHLITDADLQPVNTDQVQVITSKSPGERKFAFNTFGSNAFRLSAPDSGSNHSLYVRLEYGDEQDRKRRSINRTLELYVRECSQIESTGASDLFSVRNVQSLSELQLHVQPDAQLVLQPGSTAFIRIRDASQKSIRWSCGNRQGHIRLPNTVS